MMLKNILIATCVVVVLTLTAGYAMRGKIFYALMSSFLSPSNDFELSLAPPPPDYKQPGNWAAFPGTASPAADRPESIAGAGNPANVDVFFVHPTSYFGTDNWNQPLEDENANWIVDERVLRHQASVFNTCCEIYAPRYRQATIFSFIDQGDNGEQALDLAYQDVSDAFDEFLAIRGPARPFILAGHSQGSKHASRLLRERIANSSLVDDMVVAYLVGFSVEGNQLGGVPSCQTETQTGCAVGWNSVERDGAGLWPESAELLCINPLTWVEDTSYASHDLNRGSIGFAGWGRAEEGEDFTSMVLESAIADARCNEDGNLSIPELRTRAFPSRMQGGSMHIYDYSLFHTNIRENALSRISAMSGFGG